MSIRRGYGGLLAVTMALAGCTSDPGIPQWAASDSESPAPTTARQRCAPPTPPAGWGPLIFTDDFPGTKLNATKWSVYNDPAGRVPRDPTRVTVAGGALTITGGKRSDGRDVSGGLSSNVNFKYGHVDVCFKVDRGAGYSAIVLLWPQSEKWPDDGEIDISEVNRGARDLTHSFVHNNPTNDRSGHTTRADFTQWHVMSADWTPQRVTIYLDGVQQWTAGLDPRTAGMIPTTSPMHLAIQLDQGCDNFIECRNAATPARVVMRTDWVRIYAYKQGL